MAADSLDQRVGRIFESDRRNLASVRRRESLIFACLVACGMFSLAVTVAILVVLVTQTVNFFGFEEVTVGNFFGSIRWNPLLGAEKSFGIWALVSGTLMVTTIAMAIALPLGLITAVYLSEYAPSRVRSFLKPILEILAGIPTVVFGLFALTNNTPSLRLIDERFMIFNAMSGGIAVGILCLPTVCSLAEDALQAVPKTLREGAYGLGGTRFDAVMKVILPAALSGIVSAFLLAIARAVGETMVVAIACGNSPQVTYDPREQIQTMTGFMVQMATGDVSNYGIEYSSMYAVAGMLFLLTLSITMVGTVVRKRFREAYE
ncbi:MAG: phosphate ABC transporter permease subunit PstC [Planctomycetota bacterium]